MYKNGVYIHGRCYYTRDVEKSDGAPALLQVDILYTLNKYWHFHFLIKVLNVLVLIYPQARSDLA